jgi:hypothetical protein
MNPTNPSRRPPKFKPTSNNVEIYQKSAKNTRTDLIDEMRKTPSPLIQRSDFMKLKSEQESRLANEIDITLDDALRIEEEMGVEKT